MSYDLTAVTRDGHTALAREFSSRRHDDAIRHFVVMVNSGMYQLVTLREAYGDRTLIAQWSEGRSVLQRLYQYRDGRGLLQVGALEKRIEGQGTDLVLAFRRASGILDLVGGSKAKQVERII